jgi:hypothetical protein
MKAPGLEVLGFQSEAGLSSALAVVQCGGETSRCCWKPHEAGAISVRESFFQLEVPRLLRANLVFPDTDDGIQRWQIKEWCSPEEFGSHRTPKGDLAPSQRESKIS